MLISCVMFLDRRNHNLETASTFFPHAITDQTASLQTVCSKWGQTEQVPQDPWQTSRLGSSWGWCLLPSQLSEPRSWPRDKSVHLSTNTFPRTVVYTALDSGLEFLALTLFKSDLVVAKFYPFAIHLLLVNL